MWSITRQTRRPYWFVHVAFQDSAVLPGSSFEAMHDCKDLKVSKTAATTITNDRAGSSVTILCPNLPSSVHSRFADWTRLSQSVVILSNSLPKPVFCISNMQSRPWNHPIEKASSLAANSNAHNCTKLRLEISSYKFARGLLSLSSKTRRVWSDTAIQ